MKEITNLDIADSERIDIKKEVRKLTVAEWATFIDVFDRWPFAPEVCFTMVIDEGISLTVFLKGPLDL
jgi:hypothetical protein